MQRKQAFNEALEKNDLEALHLLAFAGCPDETDAGPLRCAVWKRLLGVMPQHEKQLHQDYVRFVEEVDRGKPVAGDPLGGTDPQWQQYWADVALKKEIGKDVRRTHSGLHFFSSSSAALFPLERILFVFAKLNKGIGYVQGLNELLAPIFYVVATSSSSSNNNSNNNGEKETSSSSSGVPEESESLSFFCFTNMMSQLGLRDCYDRTHDSLSSTTSSPSSSSSSSSSVFSSSSSSSLSHPTGIGHSLRALELSLRRHCPIAYRQIRRCGVRSAHFAVRWLTLMCAQDLTLPDTLRLWDALLSDTRSPPLFLRFFCCALVEQIFLEAGGEKGWTDFASCVVSLQQPVASLDVARVLSRAHEMDKEDSYLAEEEKKEGKDWEVEEAREEQEIQQQQQQHDNNHDDNDSEDADNNNNTNGEPARQGFTDSAIRWFKNLV